MQEEATTLGAVDVLTPCTLEEALRLKSETPGAVRTPSPMLGEHTEDVLRGLLGMGAEEIAALKASGAIR